MFDVLMRHDPDNLLLEQARREVLAAQLDYQALREVLAGMAARKWVVTTPARLTPLSFPLWADRLQTQTMTSESWRARVEREALRLERRAS